MQCAVDFGAIFAVWVAAAATHGSDAYWSATCAVVLAVELVYPPSLAFAGPFAVVAHSIATSSFDAKHYGAVAVSVLSLAQLRNASLPPWLAALQKRVSARPL